MWHLDNSKKRRKAWLSTSAAFSIYFCIWLKQFLLGRNSVSTHLSGFIIGSFNRPKNNSRSIWKRSLSKSPTKPSNNSYNFPYKHFYLNHRLLFMLLFNICKLRWINDRQRQSEFTIGAIFKWYTIRMFLSKLQRSKIKTTVEKQLQKVHKTDQLIFFLQIVTLLSTKTR